MGKQSKTLERTSERSEVLTVASATETLDALELKRKALVDARANDDVEMQKHSFAAHARLEPEARSALDQCIENALKHDSELRSIDLALTEARERLAAAQAAEAREAERKQAKELRAVLERLRVAGQTADDALAVLVEAGDAMRAALDAIHALGFSHPTGAQLLTMGERALRTAIGQTLWARIIERLPPNERVRFGNVIPKWTQMLENEITRRLGEPQNTEAA